MPIWGLTCGYFRDLWTEKSKLASMLVFWSPRGPRVPMAWDGCVGAAGYPMGCQIGRLTRHETPLARPSQATKISKPNRFAYPFRSRPRGVSRPLWLNLPEHQTPSYRDTANLGVGVRPRPDATQNKCHRDWRDVRGPLKLPDQPRRPRRLELPHTSLLRVIRKIWGSGYLFFKLLAFQNLKVPVLGCHLPEGLFTPGAARG